MKQVDELLRDTVHEMTMQVAPSAGLAQQAMAQGRRIRQRRQLATVAAAVLVVAAVAVPVGLARSTADAPPASNASPSAPSTPSASPTVVSRVITAQTRQLAGGWLVGGSADLVLNRATMSYADLKLPAGSSALPAPTGDRVLIRSVGKDFEPLTPQLKDLRTGRLTPADRVLNDFRTSWSPSGKLLLATLMSEPAGTGFAIVDAATGKVSRHRIPSPGCSQCEFIWMPDGTEVALAIADRSQGEAEELVARVQLFEAASGKPTRSIPIKAFPLGPYAFSPDGRFAVADVHRAERKFQIVELATGQSTPFPYGAVWVTDELLLAVEGNEVLTLRPDGSVVERARLEDVVNDRALQLAGPPGAWLMPPVR